MDLWRMSEALQSLASSPSTPPLTAHPEQAGTIQASPPQLPPRVPAIPSPSCCSSVEAVNFPPPLPHSPGMSPLIPIHPNPQGDGHLGVYPTCFSEMVGILQTAPLVSAPPPTAPGTLGGPSASWLAHSNLPDAGWGKTPASFSIQSPFTIFYCSFFTDLKHFFTYITLEGILCLFIVNQNKTLQGFVCRVKAHPPLPSLEVSVVNSCGSPSRLFLGSIATCVVSFAVWPE